jgi:hypothetical protein
VSSSSSSSSSSSASPLKRTSSLKRSSTTFSTAPSLRSPLSSAHMNGSSTGEPPGTAGSVGTFLASLPRRTWQRCGGHARSGGSSSSRRTHLTRSK